MLNNKNRHCHKNNKRINSKNSNYSTISNDSNDNSGLHYSPASHPLKYWLLP